MHGDGLIQRVVPWPLVDDDGDLVVRWVSVVGRRYWCPRCHRQRRVHHPGVRARATFGTAIIAALLHFVAAKPLGMGQSHAEAHHRVRGRQLPVSERARSGQPRWSSLARWAAMLDLLWTQHVLPQGRPMQRVQTLLAHFSPGGSLREVLAAALGAHASEGTAV